jgi:hypothetical protein
MNKTSYIKKSYARNLEVKEWRGRPKSRWFKGVEEKARKLGCGNWLTASHDRSRWRHLLEEVKAHLGLYSRCWWLTYILHMQVGHWVGFVQMLNGVSFRIRFLHNTHYSRYYLPVIKSEFVNIMACTLRHCATNRKVAGSILDGVTGIFQWRSLRLHCGPEVDSASNRNEYQESFLGVKTAGA